MLFYGLEFFHEPAVNEIFDQKGQSAVEQEPLFPEHTCAAAQIKNQQIVASGFEGLQGRFFHKGE